MVGLVRVNELSQSLMACGTVEALDAIWANLNAAVQRHGGIKAAYDYRKACLSDETDKFLRGG